MAYGMAGFVGIGKETTWGTAVAVTDYFEIMNEGVTGVYDRFDNRNAINARYEPDRQRGILRVSGGVSAAAFPIVLGHMMKAAMNTVSGTTVLSGFLQNHRFVSPQGDFAADCASQPYTLEVHRDVTSSFRYSGMVMNRLQLSVAPNQPLMIGADWIGQDHNLIAASAVSFPGSPVEPFAFDSCSISLGGSATSRIEAFQLSVDNQLEGIPTLNNSALIARIRRRGPQLVRVQGTLDFQDVTEFLDFKNGTERALKVSFFTAQSFNTEIHIPRMVYTAYPANIRGRERLTVAFQGECKFLTTSNTALGLYITSTKSNY